MLGLLKKRNIREGDFTYGERIRLVQILKEEERDDISRVQDIIECLHGKRVSARSAERLTPYAVEISTELIEWLKREEKECSVPPQADAIKAGAQEYAAEVGDMGAVVDLAERFGKSFADVYAMPYTEVFAIWKVDAARARYNRRLEQVMKNKQHG